MAFATTTNTRAVSGNNRIANFVATIWSELEKRRVYKRTLIELSALSTRELDDLGLSRSNLRAVAYEAAYGI